MAGWDETQEIGSDYVKVMYDHQLTLREQAQIVIDNLDAQTIAQMFQPDWFDVVQEIAEKMWSDYTTSQKLERLTASQYAQFKGVDVPKGTKLPELMSSFGVYDRRAVEWLQDYNFELIQRVKEDIRYGIKGSIMQGVAIGEDNKQIANRVRNYVTKPMPIYRKADMMAVEAGKKTMKDIRPIRFISPEHRSMMIARTESMRVFNQANFSQYQENGIERVAMSKHAGECKICVEKRIEGPWNIVDAPYLPLHPFCRHTYIPLVDPKSIMQDFRDLTQQSYGKTVGENPFQSGMDFVGNWKQGQKDKVKHAFNQLPDHLRSSRFLNEGVIQMDPLQHFGSKIVDGRHVIVGSDWTDERIITELMNSYGRLWYGRYQLQLMEHFGKKVDEIRFGEYFARYFNDPTSITDSGIRDFFEKSVFRDSFKPKEFHPDDVVRPIIEKPNIPVPKTFLKADYGANDPIRFIDENGLKWYAKPGSKDSLDMEKAVWELANDLGVRTYPDLIVAKADDVPKDLLEHWTDRQYLDGIIFTREIDGENVSKSLLEPEFFLKNNKDDIRKIAALDVLVGNSDRHYGNFMYDYKNLYAIDHGDCGWKDYVTNYFLNDLENKATTKAGFDDWIKDTFGDILNRFDRTDLNKWKGVKARDGDFIEILTNNRKNFFANIREDMDNYDFWKEEIPTKMSISGKEWKYKDDFIRYFNTLPEKYRMDVNVNVGTVLDGEFEYGFKGNTFNIYSSQDPKELIHEYIEKFIWPHYKDNGYIEYKSDFSELFFKFSQGKFNTPYTSEEKELKDFFTNLKPIQPPIEKRLVRFVDVNDDSTLNEVFILEDNLGEKWYAKATSKENAEIEKGMWNLARDLNVNTYPELHILNFSDLDEKIISQIDDLYPHILEDMEYPLLVTKNIGDNSINLRKWKINHDISEGNVEEIKRMFLLDMIGGNHDRNWGNVLINDGHFYAIDHEFSGNRFSINTINHLAMEWLDHKLYRGEFDDWFEKEFRSLVDEASEIDYSKFKFARDEKGMNLIYNVGNIKENMRDFISTNNLWKKDPSKGMEIDISRASTLQKQIVKDAFDLIPNRLKTHDSYFIQFSDARTMGIGTTRLRINKDASPENIKGEIWDHFAKSIFREYQDDIAKYKWNMSMFGTIFREYMEKGPGAPGVEKEIEQMLDILKIRPKSQKLVSESPLKLVAKKVDFKGDLPVYFKQDMNQLISLLPPEMRVDVTFRRMGKKIKPDEGEVKIIHDIYGRELIVSGVEGYARRVAKINGFDENKFVKDLKSFFDGENVDLSKYVVETPKPTLSPKVITSDEAMNIFTKQFDDIPKNDEDIRSFTQWARGYVHQGISEHLRYGGDHIVPDFIGDDFDVTPIIQSLDNNMKRLTIPTDIHVYRGAGSFYNDKKVGDIFVDKSFVSTTLDKKIAKGYSEDGYIAKIIVPEGTHGAYLDAFSKKYIELDWPLQQLLLDRDLSFQVIHKDDKAKEIILQVLPNKPTKKPLTDLKSFNIPTEVPIEKNSEKALQTIFDYTPKNLRDVKWEYKPNMMGSAHYENGTFVVRQIDNMSINTIQREMWDQIIEPNYGKELKTAAKEANLDSNLLSDQFRRLIEPYDAPRPDYKELFDKVLKGEIIENPYKDVKVASEIKSVHGPFALTDANAFDAVVQPYGKGTSLYIDSNFSLTTKQKIIGVFEQVPEEYRMNIAFHDTYWNPGSYTRRNYFTITSETIENNSNFADDLLKKYAQDIFDWEYGKGQILRANGIYEDDLYRYFKGESNKKIDDIGKIKPEIIKIKEKNWFDYKENVDDAYQNLKAKNLTKEEMEAFQSYQTRLAANVLNPYLRKGEIRDPDYTARDLNKVARTLSEGFEKQFLDQNVIAYRQWGATLFKNKKIGDTFEDKGFVSTTLSPKLFNDENFSVSPNGYTVKVLVSQGSEAVLLDQAINTTPFLGMYNQAELLINKNTKFQILDVDHKNKRAIVEVVQDTPVAKPTKSFSNLSDSEKYVMDNFDYSKTDTIKELAGYFYRGRLENYIKAIRNNDIKKINHYKNLKLKDGFLTDHEELIPKNTTFNDIGKHLTELINENKIKEDLMVFRGGEDLKGYKIGDVLENNRYVATSLNKDYAKGYIGDNYLTKIILPEGTPALSVEKIWKQVEEKYGKGLYKYKNESELLLDNINFKIIDIDHKNKTATMEVLNEKSIPKVEGRAFEKIDFKGDLPGYFKKDMQKIIDDLPDDFKVGATFKRMGKTVTPKESEIKIIYDIKGDELLQSAKDGYKDLLYKKFPDRKKEIDEAFGAKKVVEPKAKIKAPKNKKPSDYRNIYNEGIDKDNLTNWVKNNYNYGNSKKDKEAIRDYATSGFKDINPTLRNKDKLDPDDYFDADRIERIKNLKEVLNKYELKEDMVLYRNMGETNYFKNLKAGDIFKDLAPLSTTVDKKLANNWNWIQKDDTWVATIYANKGTKGVFTNGLYEAQKEGEFIIKPEQSLQIISIDKKNKKVVLQTVDVKKSESPVENVPYHFDKQPSKTLTDKDTWIESKNIDELGNHMKTLDNEVMAMFNKKGEILYTSKGDAMGVDWSAEKLDEADAIIHNHPGTSIGFSPQDMITHVEEQQYHNFREFNIAGNNLYELEVYDTRKFIEKSIDVLSPDLTSEYIEKVCREIQYDLRGVNPYKEARKVVGSQQKYAKLFDTKGNFTDPILYKEYTEELTRKAREIVDKKQVESYMQYINELGQEWGFRVNRYDYDKIDIKDLARQKVETTPFPTKVDKVVKTSKSPRDIKPLITAEDASEIPKVEQRLEYERGINPGMKFKDENGDIWYAKNIEANDLDKEEAGYQMAQAMNLKTYPEMRALRTEDVPSADRIRNAYDDYYLYTKEIPNEGDLDEFLEGEGNEFGRVPNKNQLKILGYNDTKIQEIHDRGYLFDEEEIEFDKRWVEHYKNQVYKVFVLDSAIGNQDRHLSNILVNGDDLLPIDHGILSKVETIDDEGKFIRCEPMDQLMIMGFMDRNSGDMLITKEDFLEELEPYFETMRSVNVDALQMSDSMKDMVKYNINHLEDVAKNFYDQTMINEGIVYLGW